MPAETKDVAETQSDQNKVVEPASDEQSNPEKGERREQERTEEQKKYTDEVTVEEQVEEAEAADVTEEGEPDSVEATWERTEFACVTLG